MTFSLSSTPYAARDSAGRLQLIASVCADCDQRVFPPAPVCPSCMGEHMTDLPLGGRGKLYSFTVIRQAMPDFTPPYMVGYVDMPERVRVFSHLTGVAPEALACDMLVEAVASEPIKDHLGREVLLFKFAPVAGGVESD